MADPENQFLAYRDHLDGEELHHPQKQGLSEASFREALTDPGTVTTEIGQCTVPQIVDLNYYDWLNAEYIRRQFPGHDIFHFTDYGETQYGRETAVALGRLAALEGVLIVEAAAEGTITSVAEKILLEQVEIDDLQLLGTQTYFAGQLKLTGKEQTTPSTGFLDTFEQVVQREDVDSLLPYVNRFDGVWVESVIPDDEATKMYGFYEEAYKVLNDHPCKQGLEPDDFMSMLKDPEIPKIIFRRQGEAETIFIITTKIDELSWVNFDYYKSGYPEELEADKLIWFPGIATDPNAETSNNSQKIVATLAKLCALGNYDPTIVFDFCDKNTAVLGKAIEYWILRSGSAKVKFQKIAEQKYFAVPLQAK